jgi:hypothetical protein
MVSDPFDRDLKEQTTEAGISACLRSWRVEAQLAASGEETVRMQWGAMNGAVEQQPLAIDSCVKDRFSTEIFATLQLVRCRLDQRQFAQRVDKLAKHRVRYGVVEKRRHQTRVSDALAATDC